MEQQQHNSSGELAIRILTVVGGLLAAICFVVFLALTDIARSNTTLSIAALISIIAAIIGNRTIDHLFFDTTITALYVTGCMALCYALADSRWDIHLSCFLFMLLAATTFLLSRGHLLPFLAVLLFNTSFTWFVMEGIEQIAISQVVVLLMGIVFFLLNHYEARMITSRLAMKRLFRPLHRGFFLSFACGLVWMSGIGYAFNQSVAILSICIWLGIVLMLRRIMKTMEVKKPQTEILVYIVCFALLGPTLFAPSLSGALLLLLLCFGYGHKVEMGTTLVLFIYTLAKYYYDLQLTLLVKSITLFLTGVVLLLAYYYFTKHKENHEKT